MIIKSFTLLFLLVISVNSIAQIKVNYTPNDSNAKFILSNKILKENITENELINFLPNTIKLLNEKGYWAASIDSSYFKNNDLFINIYLGQKSEQLNLVVKKNQQKWLDQIYFKPSNSIAWKDYEILQEKLLQFFENNGYPFAKIGLDSIDIAKGKAYLDIDESYEYRIDSFTLNGNANITPYILQMQTGILNGSLYSLEKINKISSALSSINYIEEIRKPEILLNANSGIIKLFYNEKKSSQFNFLLGLLPVNAVTQKFQISGDVSLQLRNAFGKGEGILANFQQLQPSSPRLQFGFDQPYIFKSSFGVDTKFELFKKDSHFLQIMARVGVIFQADANKSFKFYFQQQRNSVLYGAIDTLKIIQTKLLPDEIDANINVIGFNFNWNNTNYKPNPSKGFDIIINTNTGLKNIKKNSNITDLKSNIFNYNTLYDNIKLKDYRINVQSIIAKYFPIVKRQVLKVSVNFGWVNSTNLFRNELFQIGGFRLLRGFDEESIFASSYIVPTLEYRLLSDKNSFFYVFADGGLAKVKTNYSKLNNSYISGGLGLAFQSKNGLINFCYALGKKSGEISGLKQGSKIHFGFINYF